MNLSSLQPEVDTPFTASLTDPAVGVAVVTWFWEISPDGVTGWASLDGAASDTYTPVIGDVASYLRVTVDYDDGEGPGKRAQATPDHEVHESHPDNHAPEFTSTETGERSVDENTPAGTAIGLPVAATDEHHVDVLTYSLSGSDADDFEIVRTLGQLLTGAPLDHEARDTYSVIVRVTDPSLESDETEVTVTVTNVEEPGTVRLSSAQPVVGETFDSDLYDPDGGVSGLSWAWERSADRTNWSAIAGVASSSYTPVADDAGNHLRVTASYADARVPARVRRPCRPTRCRSRWTTLPRSTTPRLVCAELRRTRRRGPT